MPRLPVVNAMMGGVLEFDKMLVRTRPEADDSNAMAGAGPGPRLTLRRNARAKQLKQPSYFRLPELSDNITAQHRPV